MVKAIDHATGIHVQVRTFEVHSVTVGEDAQGEALLTAEHNGRTYRGAGISTNILEAAARAYLEVINRLEAANAGADRSGEGRRSQPSPTLGTDNGHEGGGGANWAIGHPEKLIDFGYRAVHETAVQSKAIVRAFYGRDPERSYFNGCSDGGREALMEAQRFPEDFNGILAGAPANNWSRLFTAFVWNERALLATPESAIPPAKLPVIQRAVMAACDGRDSVVDGLIENPLACKFDPAVLVCKGADAADCLPKAQVEALQKVYEGPRNPRTQDRLFVGQPPGTEAVPGGWGAWITPANPAGAIQFAFGNSYYGAAVFEDPKWNFRMLDFDRDVSVGDAKAGPVLNATSPDLRSFRASGGKLIQYHGWGDAAIPASSSIRVLRDGTRLSVEIPGCAHAWRSADRGLLPAGSRARHGALWWGLGPEQFRQRRGWSGYPPRS